MGSKVYNVAIIGVGEVAMTVHLPTLLLCSHMFETVALVDISKQALEHCSAKFHVRHTYTDVEEMLEDRPEVDVVMIMNANEYHVLHTVQCLRAGRHVFIEKPMSLILGGADEIIKAEKESGKSVFVGYMRRYAEAFLRVKEIVKGLSEGDIIYVRDIIGQNALFIEQSGSFPRRFTDFPDDAYPERLSLAEKMFTEALGPKASDPKNRHTWGFLNGLATHDLSAMRELIGMPERVLCATRSPDGGFMTVTFQYEGFVAYYEMGVDNVKLFDAHIEIYTKDKRVKVEYDNPYIKALPIMTTIHSTKLNGDHSEETIRPTYEDAYTLEYKAWYRSLTQDEPIKTTAEDDMSSWMNDADLVAKKDLEILTMIMEAL